MTVIFDPYIPGSSLLHCLDPRSKLWAAMLTLIVAFVLPTVGLQALFLVSIHAVLLMSAVPVRALGRLWQQMAALIILILILQPFFDPTGQRLLALGPLQLTTGGLHNAVRLALRATSIAFVTGGLLFTTPQPALVKALVKLGLPYTWGLTVSLALRFLPAIQNLYHNIRDAQSARGWTAKGGLFQRLQGHIPVLVAVLISTLRMSDQLTLALAARGLETMQQRTTWRELHMAKRDWAFLIGTAIAFGAILWWRYG